ncbi:hypothetical protein COO60DRAFT_651135 [Scenedesmus sp. NREL 46B-D3]|nr:hypothetical protein COO60DRAFT_651135 [Scenedesmus sp. NREL 46B-D3]
MHMHDRLQIMLMQIFFSMCCCLASGRMGLCGSIWSQHPECCSCSGYCTCGALACRAAAAPACGWSVLALLPALW